jgi:hypothetical protein
MLAAVAILAAACQSTASPPAATAPGALPPVPAENASPLPGQPPVVWIAGTLTDVSSQNIHVLEPSGTSVGLQRLAEDATTFYRVSGGAWRKLAAEAQIAAGQQACTETIMDGSNLLAIRVFLGAGCGPAAG